VTWHLTASKTDYLALGTSRSWGCLCGVPKLACPYHLALEHLQWLKSSGHFANGLESPLFPTLDGGVASKASVVDTFELIGVRLGQRTHDKSGLRLFGGHSPRVTGAQLFAAS
jgi:hypothetical protein